MGNRPTVFVSYCHRDQRDELWRFRIAHELGQAGIDVWDDSLIRLGAEWRKAIADAIASVDGAILLLSPDFLESNFVTTNELPQLRDRLQRGGFPIFPVEVSPCDWSAIPWLADLQIPRIPAGQNFQTAAVLAAIVRDIAAILKSPAP